MAIVTTLPNFPQPGTPASSEPAPPIESLSVDDLKALVEKLTGEKSQLQHEYDQAVVRLTREINEAKRKFASMDATIGLYQTAVAELVAEGDEGKRQKIRDGLKAE